MARSRDSEQGMTGFGKTLYSLMLGKGIEHRQDLADMLTETGYRISQQTVSNYMNGKRKIAEDFPLFVAEVLDLDDDERTRLAEAYAYSATRLSESNVTKLQTFRKQMRAMQERNVGRTDRREG